MWTKSSSSLGQQSQEEDVFFSLYKLFQDLIMGQRGREIHFRQWRSHSVSLTGPGEPRWARGQTPRWTPKHHAKGSGQTWWGRSGHATGTQSEPQHQENLNPVWQTRRSNMNYFTRRPSTVPHQKTGFLLLFSKFRDNKQNDTFSCHSKQHKQVGETDKPKITKKGKSAYVTAKHLPFILCHCYFTNRNDFWGNSAQTR